VIADTRWRDEAGLRRLSSRIYSVLYTHIGDASGIERQRLRMDALYVTRTRPTNAAFFDWRALDDVRVEPAEGDLGSVVPEIRQSVPRMLVAAGVIGIGISLRSRLGRRQETAQPLDLSQPRRELVPTGER
jgi:hypothetical protein